MTFFDPKTDHLTAAWPALGCIGAVRFWAQGTCDLEIHIAADTRKRWAIVIDIASEISSYALLSD